MSPYTVKDLAELLSMSQKAIYNRLSTQPGTMPRPIRSDHPVKDWLFDELIVDIWAYDTVERASGPALSGRPSKLRELALKVQADIGASSSRLLEDVDRQSLATFCKLFQTGKDRDLNRSIRFVRSYNHLYVDGFPATAREQLLKITAAKSGLTMEQLEPYNAMSQSMEALICNLTIVLTTPRAEASEPLPEGLSF